MLSQASRSGVFFLVPRHRNDGNSFVQSVLARRNDEAIQDRNTTLGGFVPRQDEVRASYLLIHLFPHKNKQ